MFPSFISDPSSSSCSLWAWKVCGAELEDWQGFLNPGGDDEDILQCHSLGGPPSTPYSQVTPSFIPADSRVGPFITNN